VPKLLIQARIASGLTHEKLAVRLAVKPQQIQRWEEDDHQTASFWRLIEVAETLGLSFSVNPSLPSPARQPSQWLSTSSSQSASTRASLPPG
jgi:HTH-type transcriptional regulator/antitoxin HigA